ncbi:unnamed protein product [Hymenolepis diminuta]|uniref:C2 domain-containing protein n=1 Tax=Hymenolepis diminuta TaxID=6216 RepID=A0A158QCU2_HYMDI|nr:unnamed protein product [Hymenolepis diminuta]
MPLFGSKKTENAVEPGPNPFKPPMILNIHMKYDERVQTLDVLVRNLQNSPLREKIKIVGTFVERNNCKKKKSCLIGRIIRREKTDAEGYIINSHSTPAKPGPNPHYNINFPFSNLIRGDVQCGKLVFEIFETSLAKNKLIGCVEMEGSEIQIDRDAAYSLYVRDPTCVAKQREVIHAQRICTGDHGSTIDENAMILHSNIQFDDRHQKLTIFIRNLRNVDDKLPHSVSKLNPCVDSVFIKCVLYTADGRRFERRTSTRYGCNPYFNQELKFSKLVQADIRGGHLLFTVNEMKRFGKNVIGMGIIPGSKINLVRDEAYNTPIVQQYCSKISKKFTYNPRDVITEPENLVRVVYPESQKHIEVYK